MKMITRYRAPRRAVYLGSGSLVALGGASLGCYRFPPSPSPSPSPSVGLPHPWWPILGRTTSLSCPSSSCTQVITSFLKFPILKTLLSGFGLGYGPIVFMLQGVYFSESVIIAMRVYESLFRDQIDNHLDQASCCQRTCAVSVPLCLGSSTTSHSSSPSNLSPPSSLLLVGAFSACLAHLQGS